MNKISSTKKLTIETLEDLYEIQERAAPFAHVVIDAMIRKYEQRLAALEGYFDYYESDDYLSSPSFQKIKAWMEKQDYTHMYFYQGFQKIKESRKQ